MAWCLMIFAKILKFNNQFLFFGFPIKVLSSYAMMQFPILMDFRLIIIINNIE